MQTIYDIASQLKKLNSAGTADRTSPSVTEGLDIHHPPGKPGLVQLTPEQCAGVYVERVSLNGKVDGYQRQLSSMHARRVARALARGEDVAEVTLGIDNGRVFAVDGQHRLVGAVIARKPIWAVVRPMLPAVRAKRFSDQSQARRVNRDILVLSADDLVARYIKKALAANETGGDHPWDAIVGLQANAARVSPGIVYEIITRYHLGRVGGQGAVAASIDRDSFSTFKPTVGDEFADLLRSFGTKSTNPLAFRPAALKAATDVAVLAVRRADDHAGARDRWIRHMPSFDWSGYAWLSATVDLRGKMLDHWNKRLSADKRIYVT